MIDAIFPPRYRPTRGVAVNVRGPSVRNRTIGATLGSER